MDIQKQLGIAISAALAGIFSVTFADDSMSITGIVENTNTIVIEVPNSEIVNDIVVTEDPGTTVYKGESESSTAVSDIVAGNKGN